MSQSTKGWNHCKIARWTKASIFAKISFWEAIEKLWPIRMEDQSVSSSSYICTWWFYVCSDNFQVLLSCGNWQSFDFFCGIWKNMSYLNIWVWRKGKRKEPMRNPAHPYALCTLHGLASYSFICKKGILFYLHPASFMTTSIHPLPNVNPDY